MCTDACDAQRDCAVAGDSAECAELAQVGGCDGAGGAERVCLAGCERDADCRESGVDVEWSCGDERLCDLTGSCVAAGEADALGVAVLAMAAAPPDDSGEHDIRQFAIDGESIVWVDFGTFDGGVANGDRAVYQRSLPDGETVTLASNLGQLHNGEVQVDADRVYFSDDQGLYAAPRDASAEPVELIHRALRRLWSSRPEPAWVVEGEWVYYAEDYGSAMVRRVRTDGSGDELFHEASGEIHRLAVTPTHLLVEVIGMLEPATSLVRIDKDARTEETVIASFREHSTANDGPLLVLGDFIVTDSSQNSVSADGPVIGIRRYSLSSGENVSLVDSTDSAMRVRSAHEGQVYFAVEMPGPWIGRTALEASEPERLRTTGSSIGHVAAAEGYLYWVEAHRLLRMPLAAD